MIEVGSVLKTESAWDKDMNITHDGQEIRVILHWDSHDGYEWTWLDLEGRFTSEPQWAQKIDEEGTTYPSGLGYFLDCLSAHTKVNL